MNKYGIIGKPLEHSYSALYFTDKFTREHIDAEYQAYEINDLTNIDTLMQELCGFNVTHPYKQTIMAHLQDIDPVAKEIGAVNVVHKQKGYNTDWIGFMQSIAPHLTENDKHALLLGTGGASKAVQYALQELGLHFTLVSRTPTDNAIGYNLRIKSICFLNSATLHLCYTTICFNPSEGLQCAIDGYRGRSIEH